MLDFVVDNYLMIIIITMFLIFALIGYAVDSIKNKKNYQTFIFTYAMMDTEVWAKFDFALF